MQKALVQMNLQLHHVISDLTGVTGLRIVRDILAGVRDPATLAAHRDYRCRATVDEIVAVLTGHSRPEHLFALRQNLEAYEFLKGQIDRCDAEVEAHLAALAADHGPSLDPLPAPRRKTKPRDNDPRFEIRSPLQRLTGAGLSQIDAIGPYSALRLVAEIGTDMTRWPTEKHFTAWLPSRRRTRYRAAVFSARARNPPPTGPPPSSAAVCPCGSGA
jgi:hypothetical protein